MTRKTRWLSVGHVGTDGLDKKMDMTTLLGFYGGTIDFQQRGASFAM